MSNQECHECWGTGMSCATPGRPCNACRPEVWLQTIVGEHQSDLERVTRERDEARAEVKRLVGVVKEAQSLTPGAVQDGVERVLRGLLSTREQQIASLTRERDEAMGLMRENQRLASEATQQALDSATRLGKVADAVRALLEELDNPEGSLTWSCRECPRVSTCQVDGSCYCDEHSPGGGWDTTYAPVLRALRALLEGKPGDTKTEVERLKAERDHQQKRAEALEEAARALLAELDKEARQCGKCYALATVAQGLPRGGFVFHCDKHVSLPSAGWQDDPREDYPTNVAAPLRALRALLADPSPR